MDAKHADSLREGARIAVFMGAAVADIYGTPPIVTTATVIGKAEQDRRGEPLWWLDVDIAQNQTLPQMYGLDEIIGFLMPMAKVYSSEDGQTTVGVLPEGYVGP